ncbi:hypothetical protein V5O48_014579 [Marasmius crinis-equi]|uniref:Uncharacterized protein n=1 Tax=Marasmius crinis-equi TaxID=585013 RepID=A0ABR3EWW8_9AGAR
MQSTSPLNEPLAVDQHQTQDISPISSREATPPPQLSTRTPASWGVNVDVQTEHRERRLAWTNQPNNLSGWGDTGRLRYVWRADDRILWFYVREDWVGLPLSWLGVAGRDTSFDNLDNVRWAEMQLYRCSPQAADSNVGPPTFTGPQVLQRSEMVRNQLRQLRDQEHQIESNLSEVRSQIRDLDAALENLKDLDVLAHGLRH